MQTGNPYTLETKRVQVFGMPDRWCYVLTRGKHEPLRIGLADTIEDLQNRFRETLTEYIDVWIREGRLDLPFKRPAPDLCRVVSTNHGVEIQDANGQPMTNVLSLRLEMLNPKQMVAHVTIVPDVVDVLAIQERTVMIGRTLYRLGEVIGEVR